jgi:HNH endonuclease
VTRTTGPGTVCSEDGCGEEVYARGLCRATYYREASRRWREENVERAREASREASRRRRGALERRGRVLQRQDLELRFFRKVQYDGETGCWLWQGALHSAGYGFLSVGGRNQLAHRVAYRLFVGPIPDGLELDHLCRVKHCVNPAHLEPVTTAENLRRGREARPA